MSTADSTGLTVDGLDDQLAALITNQQTAFGDNAKNDDKSVWGQVLRLFAQALADHGEILQYDADALNMNAASGVALSNGVLLNGIQRAENAYSTVSLTCTSNAAGCTIPLGSIVKDPDTDIQWATDSELILAASSSDAVSATATTTGAHEAAAGTITEIVTPIYGWASVTNAAAATTGQTEETDPALRRRRTIVAERASSSSTSAIYAAVTDVSGVTSCTVVEGTGNNGVPLGYLRVVVLGGADNDIAEAIFTHKAGGILTYGDDSGTYSDTVTGNTETVYFDRPTDVNIYIIVEIRKDADYPTDGDDQIKTALTTYFGTLQIGDDIEWSRLFTPINTVDGHYVDDLFIGTTASPTASENITIEQFQRPVLLTANITVNWV
jgi:uncharacterized phage protein gp47/JayE